MCHLEKMENKPFEKLKGSSVNVVTPQILFNTKCPEVLKKPTSKVVQYIWDSTQGNPCRKCNRPNGCKLSIRSKID